MSLDLQNELSVKVNIVPKQNKTKQNHHKKITHISIQLIFLPKHILAPAPKAKKNLCMSP
jgi:hypothetical protein